MSSLSRLPALPSSWRKTAEKVADPVQQDRWHSANDRATLEEDFCL